MEKKNVRKRILGICQSNEYYTVVVGQKTVSTYEDRKRNKITDFDGNISYEDWEVIKTYAK